jgi:hypothetical protein
MRTLSAFVAVALFALVGCSGDKGKTGETGKVKGEGGKELTVTPPDNTTIKQGDPKQVTVKIKRTKFEDPVMVTLDDLPKGVSAEEKEGKIEKDKTEFTFTLKADKEAKPEKGQVVKVTAKGPGMEQTVTFKLDIEEKK